MDQKARGENKSFLTHKINNNGFASTSANDPVIEKTNKIISIWKFEVIPHFSFSFFILQI